MIVVDTETSGTEPHIHGLLSIGAVDLCDPSRDFYGECRVWDTTHIMKESLVINGFTRESIEDPLKQSEEELVRAFISWALLSEDYTIAGQNPSFDRDFIMYAAHRAHINWPFAYRTIDLHTACLLHMQFNGVSIPKKSNHSDLGLDDILTYCNLPNRKGFHHAKLDAYLEAEALARIFYHENRIDTYQDRAIPWNK
jgi:DNA polymerase III epsilon subunit-like protein